MCPGWTWLIRAQADTGKVKRFMCWDMAEKTKWLWVWEVHASVGTFQEGQTRVLKGHFPTCQRILNMLRTIKMLPSVFLRRGRGHLVWALSIQLVLKRLNLRGSLEWLTANTCAKRCVPQTSFTEDHNFCMLSKTICETESPNCYILTKGPDTQNRQNKRAAIKADVVSCCLCLRERAATH